MAPPLGEVSRVLAASRPGGVFVCLGCGAGETAMWIQDGMDLSARLVVVVEETGEADTLRPFLADDLRVTVHVQEAVSFLRDVRDHRFDLITDLNPGQPAELTRLALARLATGAFYMSLHSGAELAELLGGQDDGDVDAGPDTERLALADLGGQPGISLLVRGPYKHQAKRRGGRRARQGVTPLFSARPARRR
jgi:hypothetical protein